MKKLMMLAVAIAGLAVTGSASAQYYGGGYYAPPPPGYDPYGRPYGYRPPRPPPGYGYDRRYGDNYGYRARLGRFCETGRGSCYTRPVPVGSGCRCDIPGFGLKRGIVQ
jgi:hypothetical protein